MKPQQLSEITRFTHQSTVIQGTRGPWPVKAQCTVEIQARTLLPVSPESLSPGRESLAVPTEADGSLGLTRKGE